jgi:hypothetical protein
VSSTVLTGVWTRAVDRQPVFDALMARRSWAVWDTRAIVWFTVNDVLAGEDLNAAPGTMLTARIRLSAEDVLQRIEVVSDGRAVWQGTRRGPDVDEEIPLGPATRATYFYLRARQQNGAILYSSPVYVGIGG